MGLPPHAKFCENRLKGFALRGKFIPKIPHFDDFEVLKPIHFYTYNIEIWLKGVDLQESLNDAKFRQNRSIKGLHGLRLLISS